jgi:hypothetical protein
MQYIENLLLNRHSVRSESEADATQSEETDDIMASVDNLLRRRHSVGSKRRHTPTPTGYLLAYCKYISRWRPVGLYCLGVPYDVESGKEWYAPIRYFQDLRAAAAPLHPSMSQIPFPKQSVSIFGSPLGESAGERQSKCRQLEYFLRTLCAMIKSYIQRQRKLRFMCSRFSAAMRECVGL